MLKSLAALDANSLLWFNRLQCYRPLTVMFRAISHSGDGYLYVALVLVALLQFDAQSMLFVKVALLAFVFEIPSFICLKQFLKRTRPFDALSFCHCAVKPSDEFSMPSGHTAAAFVMAAAISTFFPSLALLAYAWAGLIGFSRVFLGVHYPTDIAVGALLGLSCTSLSIAILT